MSEAIRAFQLPINKIFSDDYILSIPPYQRPYAWVKEQIEELLIDFNDSLNGTTVIDDTTPPYFLGSIVLINSSESQRHYDIVDGQQRLTTLCILLAVLRHLEPNLWEGITKLIYQRADGVSVRENVYRLSLRASDAVFFQDYIQKLKDVNESEDGITKFINKRVNVAELSDSQKRIYENTLYFLEQLSKMDSEKRKNLIQFIATRCLLVVITASDQASAYRIFSVLNNRGLDLSHADIFKADILGGVPSSDEDIYVAKWDTLEERLTREKFQNLFSHIRMIYRRQKSKDTILKEFYAHVLPHPKEQPREFINSVLVPYAEAYETIEKADYNDEIYHFEINNLFKMLNDHDNSDWLPPAIYYLAHRRGQAEDLLFFFKDLERLATYLMISRATINERINRYGQLLEQMRTILQPKSGEKPQPDSILYSASVLQLSDIEKEIMVAILDNNIYEHPDGLYILLRLNSELSEERGYHKYKSNTIEHVLPQSPSDSSEWVTWFPDKTARYQWTHRLANLVLLSGRKNASASNRPLKNKIDTYFKSKNKTSSFELTTGVLGATEWTPDILEERQKQYVGILTDMWRLK